MKGVEILLIVAIVMQAYATIVALSLINRTKYKALWVFCIVSLTLLTVERLSQILIFDGIPVSPRLQAWIGIGVSFSFSMCVICARLLVVHVDRITLQRRMLENKLMTAVLRTEERSRAEISRELHDGLGPLLSSAKMSLSAISKEGMTEKDKSTLRNTTLVIDEAIRSLREISNNLSPHMLNNFGLARGIKNFIDRVVSLHHDVDIHFVTGLKTERFDSNIEVIIYRVACELINNSLKHSKCKHIDIELMLCDNRIILKYRDDGCGFCTTDTMERGMGISNINSRVASISGIFELESSVGRGMSANIDIPLDNNITRATKESKGQKKRNKRVKHGK